MTNYFSVKKNTNYTLTVSKSGYETHTEIINISADTTKDITLTPSFTPETVRFDYTGAVQTYTVPQGCTKLIVDCVGAIGGANIKGTYGGKGGRVQCFLTVTANQIVYIYIGGKGQNANTSMTTCTGGWNGGADGAWFSAGGGGSSDIRIGGTTLNDRKIVAGGAGGSFCYNDGSYAAGGGAGGGLNGGNGITTVSSQPAATGGTQSTGGSGGWYGNNGSLGNGGQYGGGGGYYGGGGQGTYGMNFSGSAGGGSSYTDPTLCSNVTHTQGYSEANGNGWIIITTSNE